MLSWFDRFVQLVGIVLTIAALGFVLYSMARRDWPAVSAVALLLIWLELTLVNNRAEGAARRRP